MRFIDLFAGIGGFHYGIHKAIGEMGSCVYSNEWDKYANSVYRKHYGECDNRDIRTVEAKEIPEFDLLAGGFPCQAFSIAGKRGGFGDTRGTLFFEMARIAKEKHPRLLLFENVKGLLSHDSGRTFATIIQTIDELGYDCQWQVLNSKNHGVPQNRERIFIVGHLRGTPRPKVFPIGESDAVNNELEHSEQTGGERISSALDSNYYKGWGQGRTMIHIPEATKKGYAEAHIGQSINLSVPNSKTRRGRVSDVAQTIDTGMQQHTLTKDMKIRRLTPIECERLQGFPDNWTQYGADGELISDTQRYKMAGNAVTTNVITEIAKRLFILS